MGNTPARSPKAKQNPTFSSYRNENSMLLIEINKKIEEKNDIYIVMTSEIEEAITQNSQNNIKLLINEVSSHIIDLEQIKTVNYIPKYQLRKAREAIQNFQISLAKLKSCLEYRESTAPTQRKILPAQNPDVVNDLVVFDTEQNYSLEQEEQIKSIEDKLTVLKNCFDGLSNNFIPCYEIDKGLFFLQTTLNNMEIGTGSPLHQRKLQLTKDVADFKESVSEIVRKWEEQKKFVNAVDTLALELDRAATIDDFQSIHGRALGLQEDLQRKTWKNYSTQSKENVLNKLSMILQTMYLKKNSEPLYDNLNSESRLNDDEKESLESIDRVLNELPDMAIQENADSELYCNVGIIRKQQDANNGPLKLQMTSSTDYQKVEANLNENVVGNVNYKESIKSKKRPLPLPRNFEETVISNLPRHWHRLNEISRSSGSHFEKNEIEEIIKQVNIAQSLFEGKIKRIMESYEETVNL